MTGKAGLLCAGAHLRCEVDGDSAAKVQRLLSSLRHSAQASDTYAQAPSSQGDSLIQLLMCFQNTRHKVIRLSWVSGG
jgi:hypothetical protein